MIHPKTPARPLRAAAVFALCLALALGLLAGCATASAAQPQSTPAASSTPSPSASEAAVSPSSTAAASTQTTPDARSSISASMDAAEKEAGMLWPLPAFTYIVKEGGPGQGHRGLDIAAEAGSSIVAAASGKVTTAGWHYSYGNHVVLEHENGLVTLYAHCQELLVEEGQTVQVGDSIATVGSTGNTTGNALHFEVQQKTGGLLNPLDYVEAPGPLSGQADGDPDSMMFPVPDAKYISRGMGNEHRGVDIGAPAGSSIVAAAPGTVPRQTFTKATATMW